MIDGQVYNRSSVASGIHKSKIILQNKKKNRIENIEDTI
jgi:hypothetical protein